MHTLKALDNKKVAAVSTQLIRVISLQQQQSTGVLKMRLCEVQRTDRQADESYQCV